MTTTPTITIPGTVTQDGAANQGHKLELGVYASAHRNESASCVKRLGVMLRIATLTIVTSAQGENKAVGSVEREIDRGNYY